MNANQVGYFVQAQAVLARIAAMQAENQQCVVAGHSPAYCEEAFEVRAQELDHLAQQIFIFQ